MVLRAHVGCIVSHYLYVIIVAVYASSTL